MMRMLLVCALVGGALPAAPLLAAPPKAPKPDVGAGRVAWFDITTTNLARSKEFYGKLFAWEFTTVPGAENLAAEIVSRGTSIGTLRVAEGAISGFNGVAYIQVADIKAACEKAKALGGTVVPGFPFDLSDNGGAVGLVVDPVGHPIGMYSQTPLAPAPAPKPAGSPSGNPAPPRNG